MELIFAAAAAAVAACPVNKFPIICVLYRVNISITCPALK